jgi:hemerythrin-like domain-containing protein
VDQRTSWNQDKAALGNRRAKPTAFTSGLFAEELNQYETAAQVRRLLSITTTRFLHRGAISEIRQASRSGQSHKANPSQSEFDECRDRGSPNCRTDATVRRRKRRLAVKCTDLLRQDHKIILRSLDVLQRIVFEENPEQVDQNDAATLLRFLRVFADEHHHMKEEGVLFPELMRISQTEAGPLRHLLFEHSQERSLVEGLEDALRRTKTAEFAVFANRLSERVRNHIQKEDGILFPILDVLISGELDQKVTAGFGKF